MRLPDLNTPPDGPAKVSTESLFMNELVEFSKRLPPLVVGRIPDGVVGVVPRMAWMESSLEYMLEV